MGFSQARAGPKVMSSSVKSCQVVSNQQKVVSGSHVKDEKYCQVMSSDANHAETPCPRVASAYTPPIDESRSGPARSAVNQAKTHFEKEAELAIMHAKKTVLVTPTCGADMHRKGSDHKANRAVRRRDTMDDGLCVQCVCLCTSTKPHGGSWIPDPGSGIRDRGKRGGVRRGLGKGAPKGVHSTPSRRFIPSSLPKKHIHPQPAFQSAPDPR